MTSLGVTRTRRAAWAWASAAAVSIPADVLFNPQHRHVLLCPFKALTGLQCPLCGSLRAVDAAVHGQLQQAWHDNALLWLLTPMVAVYFAAAASGRPVRASRRAVALVALVAAVFTALRNAFPALQLLPT